MPSRGFAAVAVLSVAGLALAAAPGSAQVWVHVPRRGGVSVPVDPSGHPLGIPGAEPAAPTSARPDAGFLMVEVAPPAATIYVDGRPLGTAEGPDGAERVLALPPGTHRVDLVHPGFVPQTTSVVVVARHTAVLRTTLTPENAAGGGGTGYTVVPVR